MFQSLFICIGAESRDERGSRSAITSILSVPPNPIRSRTTK